MIISDCPSSRWNWRSLLSWMWWSQAWSVVSGKFIWNLWEMHEYKANSISLCVYSPVYAVLMVETLTLHQGDLPWDPGQPFYSVSVPPPASWRSGWGPPHALPHRVLFTSGYESVSAPFWQIFTDKTYYPEQTATGSAAGSDEEGERRPGSGH